MCGGGGGGSASPATYSSIDGMSFADPNQAANRDRELQLAGAFGFDRNASKYEDWAAGLQGDVANSFKEYNSQGLTAADYRSEQRIKEQEAQQKAAEDQRKTAITTGRAAIDTGLSSFDDNYYKGISDSVLNYYLPQLNDQFGKANDNLTYSLARSGNLKSTEAGKQRADLQGKYDTQRIGVTNNAADSERQARENVSGVKSNLLNYNDVAADPAAVNDQLLSETARVRAFAPQLTPMGQLFSDYVTPILQTAGTGLAAEANGYKGFNTGLFGTGKSNSSYNVER